MPYIKQERRDLIDLGLIPESAGELNFVITRAVDLYRQKKGLSYQTINDIVGALEAAKIEFYRRLAVPYERVKLTENGDVYGEAYDAGA